MTTNNNYYYFWLYRSTLYSKVSVDLVGYLIFSISLIMYKIYLTQIHAFMSNAPLGLVIQTELFC